MKHYSENVPIELGKKLQDCGYNRDPDYWYYKSDRTESVVCYNRMLALLCVGHKKDKFVPAPYYADVFDWLMDRNIYIEIAIYDSNEYKARVFTTIDGYLFCRSQTDYSKDWFAVAGEAIEQAISEIKKSKEGK